jgi:hypothetical protein
MLRLTVTTSTCYRRRYRPGALHAPPVLAKATYLQLQLIPPPLTNTPPNPAATRPDPLASGLSSLLPLTHAPCCCRFHTASYYLFLLSSYSFSHTHTLSSPLLLLSHPSLLQHALLLSTTLADCIILALFNIGPVPLFLDCNKRPCSCCISPYRYRYPPLIVVISTGSSRPSYIVPLSLPMERSSVRFKR